MPSTFSPSLRIELMAPGEQAGTWNTTTNTNLGTLLESAIAGATSVSVISANQALTVADGAADQSRNAVLQLTTTTGAPFNVYAPPVSKQYTIYNTTAFAATIFNSTIAGNTTAAGTGVTIPAGRTMTVWTNGTNVRVQNDHVIGNLAGNVTGNFTGNVTGNVTGNADTATTLQTARNINGVSFNGSANVTIPVNTTQRSDNVAYQVPFVSSVTAGDQNLFTDSAANITYNPSTNTLTTTTFVGALTGNVTGNLNGNLTATAPTANTAAFGTNTTQVATTAFVQAALQALHPVGSIYINATNSANPSTYFGFGTWVAFGAGRVPVGFNAADPLFDTAEETGGSKDATVVSHTHTFSATTGSAGTHDHIQGVYFENISGTLRNETGASGGSSKNAGVSGGGGVTGVTDTAGAHTHSVSGTTESTGSSGTNANLQPYITVYMWKRTA